MRRQAILPLLGLLFSTALFAACGPSGTDAPPAIDREVFIATYVDLRLAALDAPDFLVPPEEREEILRRHGVTQDDLLRFADVHGRDIEYMNDLWAEIEVRIEERRVSDA